MKIIRNSLSVTCIALLFFIIYPIASKAQNSTLTEAEKKILITNFGTILADVKNDFKSIATGEMKEWQGKKISLSKVQLLPAYYQLYKMYSICYGMDELNRNVPNNFFLDVCPFSIGEMYAALAVTLKAKGFVEVQPQRTEAIDTIRAFRSKDAVVFLKGAKDRLGKDTKLFMGKFSHYFATSVLVVMQ